MVDLREISDIEANSSSDDQRSINGADSSFIQVEGNDSSDSEDEGDIGVGADMDVEEQRPPEIVDDDQVDEDEDVEIKPDDVPEVEFDGDDQVRPLSSDEVSIFRMYLRGQVLNGLREPVINKKSKKETVFRVPKEHPVFDGCSGNLETFIVEMELTHAKETNGTAGDKHNPDFITKLIPYFKESTAARIWFKMYASRRTKSSLKLTWNKLVRDLRASYGVFDRPDIQFEDHYDMAQKSYDVKTYIAKKCEAALLSEDLTPRLLKFGFIRGLNEDIRKYVKLQKPETLEEAQRIAIDFENSIKGKSTNRPTRVRLEGTCSDVTRRSSPNNNGAGDGKRKRNPDGKGKLNESQAKALEELRVLRRNKCFECGVAGHRREECKATGDIVKNHKEVVAKLKDRINGNK